MRPLIALFRIDAGLSLSLAFVLALVCVSEARAADAPPAPAAPAAPAAQQSQLGPYLYEQLEKPAYKATFMALFKGEQVEPWLREYLKDRNGVDVPMETRTHGGTTYEFYQVCQPHNCGGNFLYVLFEAGGAHAWAMLTKDEAVVGFYGHPDAAMQAALKDAADITNQ